MGEDFVGLRNRFGRDIQERKLILALVRCSIEYWGRSRSVVGEGDRLIIIKPDTTLIVHSPVGFKPLNWMSSPTDSAVEVVDGRLLLHSQRTRKPFEEIKITVSDVIDYQAFEGLIDRESITVTHNEKDMRDYLASHPGEVDPDFKLKSVEYKSPVGFFDLYGRIRGIYTVVELKSERAGLPAALQVVRYRNWLREHLRQDVGAILMAPSIAPTAQAIIRKEGISFRKFNIRKISKKALPKHTLDEWL
ncbi:MAG: endonuclease NucS domain-containing protein [Candidatus Altiarchaeota archaeon]